MAPKPAIAIIVQARMGATRLPGKPLLHVLNKPLLSYLLERLKRSKLTDKIIVATTDKPLDDPLAELAKKEHVLVYRGSEEDVLDRYLKAAEHFKCQVIIRITADCPLADPEIIDQMVAEFLDKKPDYLSNTQERTFPRGLDVEIFSLSTLKKAAFNAKAPEEREHVTLFMYRHPEIFQIASFSQKGEGENLRWTVDTKEDFDLIKKIFESIYPKNPHFHFRDALDLIQKKPELSLLNQHIQQKTV